MAQIRLIGTDPSQVPTNGMLGSLAFQSAESVSIEKLVVTSAVDIKGGVTTLSGSAISYGSGETYQIWNDDPESSAIDTSDLPAAFRTLKTFVASKSGSLIFKFSAYIQSGTFYFAWRIINQASTVLSSGHYSSGLDAGQTTAVHEYRRFIASVGNVTPGDTLTLQMVSAAGSGSPTTGNATGQILYAKEFRAYSTTPSVDHGGSSNVWGKNVAIGVQIPGSYNYNLLLSPITRLDVRGPNVANNVASLGSTPPATMYVGSSSGWGQNDGGSIALGGAANASQFTATYAGIAGRRQSIHGWEYGGYLTLSTVTIGTDQLSERARIRADGMFEVKGGGVAGTSPALSVSGSAPANSLVLDSNGRVGLGTSALTNSANLDIQLDTVSATDTYAKLQLRSGNYGYIIKGGLKQEAGGQLHFDLNNNGSVSTQMVLDTGGRLGIGNVGPTYKLTIDKQGTADWGAGLKRILSLDNNWVYSTFRTPYTVTTTTHPAGWYNIVKILSWDFNVNIHISFSGDFTADQIDIEAKSSWNAGLNNNNAGPHLRVNRTMAHNGNRLQQVRIGYDSIGNTYIQAYLNLTFGAAGAVKVAVVDKCSAWADTIVKAEPMLTTATSITVLNTVNLANTAGEYYNLNGGACDFVWGTNATERLRITSTGTLNFVGAGTAGSTQAVSFSGSAPVNSLVLDSNGRVGLGISAPLTKLHINLTGSAVTPIVNVGSFGASGVVSLGSITNNSEKVYLGTGEGVNGGVAAGIGFEREANGWDSALSFYTNNVTLGLNGVSAIQEKMRLTSAGNLLVGSTGVGVGTTGKAVFASSQTYTNSGDNAGQVHLINKNNTTNNRSSLQYYSLAGVVAGIDSVNRSHTAQTGDLQFWTVENGGLKDTMRMSNGLVGIGVITSLQEKLNIVGNIRIEASPTEGPGFSSLNTVYNKIINISKYQNANHSSWFFVSCPTDNSSYGRGGNMRLRVNWTTGHASGTGYVEANISWRSNHTSPEGATSGTGVAVAEFSKIRSYFIGGSFYGWAANPNLRIYQGHNLTGGAAGFWIRAEGGMGDLVNNAGYDGYAVCHLYAELYTGDSHNKGIAWNSYSTSGGAPANVGSEITAVVLTYT